MTGTTALVLGAGLGVRMGGPKVHLVTPDGPLITRLVARLREGGCATVVVATRNPYVPAVERALATGFGIGGVIVTAVDSAEPAETLAHAVQLSLERGLLGATVVVSSADSVPPAISTVTVLISAVAAGALVATPEHAGRSGHPVACARNLLEQAYGSSGRSRPPTPLREVIRSVAEHRVRVPVADPTVNLSLDTPEQFAAVFGRAPQFFS